jgi:diguanylate cyclase (GGDEF)-like protein/PAS domain S-box-containing protein
VDVYRFAFDQAPEPMLGVTADGRIADANAAACRQLGYRHDELLTQSIWERAPSWALKRWQRVWQSLIEQRPKQLSLALRDRSGRSERIEFSIQLYPVGDSFELILYAREPSHEHDARDQLRRLSELLDVSESIAHIGHWRLPVATGRPQWSDQVFAILRRDPARGEPTFEEHALYVARDDWPRLRKAVSDCAKLGLPYAVTVGIHRDDGSAGTVRIYGSILPQSDAKTPELAGFVIDISEQQEAEDKLLNTQRQLDIALDASGIGVYQVELDTGVCRADARYFAMLGVGPDAITPTLEWWRQMMHPDDRSKVQQAFDHCLESGHDTFKAEYRMRHHGGHWVWIEDHARLLEPDATGHWQLAIGVHLDISERKNAEHNLDYRANHDYLTQLPNRHSFWCALKRVHAQSQRSERSYCIAMLDLDHFKAINDQYGHKAGDEVLAGVASHLRSSVREGDWAARWGGEEFIVLMPATSAAQAMRSMERLRAGLAATTFEIGDRPVRVTISAGIAESSSDDATPDTVITRADDRLYEAKRLGRNQVRCAARPAAAGYDSDPLQPPSETAAKTNG